VIRHYLLQPSTSLSTRKNGNTRAREHNGKSPTSPISPTGDQRRRTTGAGLRCGGAAMSNGPGRIRIRARRAVIAGDGIITTRQAMVWIWPRRQTFRSSHYERARKVLREFCEPIGYERRGRCSTRPGGLVWRAMRTVERAQPHNPPTGKLWPKGSKYPEGWPAG
jgi:hypothetical protein